MHTEFCKLVTILSFHGITKRTVFLLSILRWCPLLVLWCLLRSSESCTLTDGLSTNDTKLYSRRNFLFFFPVWHSEGKTRRILLGFEQKRLYPLMNRIIVTFGENANMRWEKIIIICFLACHWCVKHNKNNNKLFQYYHFYTWCYWVSLNDLSSIFRAEVIWEISL